MKRAFRYFQGIAAIQRAYFRECGAEIAVRNLQLMRTAGFAGTIVYSIYFLITELFFKEWDISPLYILIVPVLIVFLFYANRALAKESVNVRGAFHATLLLYMVLMLYLIIMSVFPHPNVPSVYYPLFLMMAPVLFILPACQHVVMTVLSLIVFYALVLRYKMPVCWTHELFEATTAAVFSGIVVVLMTQFRIQSDSLKTKYYALSRRDSLTGTLNKASGEEAARECLNGMRKSDHAAMLLLDIDNFKSINDSCGHLEGDRILKLIGSTLITLCRKDDIVCRFGGDEFMILLKGVQTAGAAAEKARSILDEIARLEIGGKSPKTPALSIGICYYGDDKIDCEELIRRADAALYHAKRAGKNRFEVWSSTM